MKADDDASVLVVDGSIGILKNWRWGRTARTRRMDWTLQGVNTLPNPDPEGCTRYPVSNAIKFPFGSEELYGGYWILEGVAARVHPPTLGSPGIGAGRRVCSTANVGMNGLLAYTGGLEGETA